MHRQVVRSFILRAAELQEIKNMDVFQKGRGEIGLGSGRYSSTRSLTGHERGKHEGCKRPSITASVANKGYARAKDQGTSRNWVETCRSPQQHGYKTMRYPHHREHW